MANKKKTSEKEYLREDIWTPPGIFSFPFFVQPDEGRKLSDGLYKVDLFIPKATFKEHGKAIQDAVLRVGKSRFSDFTLKGEYHTPFKDTDLDDTVENDRLKNCIMIRAKGNMKDDRAVRPVFIGPRKNSQGAFDPLSDDAIAEIKGGDWGRVKISLFPYDFSTDSKGVSCRLLAVQFWKSDEPLGGRRNVLEAAEEFEEAEADAPGESLV